MLQIYFSNVLKGLHFYLFRSQLPFLPQWIYGLFLHPALSWMCNLEIVPLHTFHEEHLCDLSNTLHSKDWRRGKNPQVTFEKNLKNEHVGVTTDQV